MNAKANASGSWRLWKRSILIAVAVLCLADIALGVFVWQGSREGPAEMKAQAERLRSQAKLLEADVQRGEKIRASLPQVGKDCYCFYHYKFLEPATAYSAVESDLQAIAQKSNLKTTDLTFRQKPLKDHGVTEVSITGTVEGEYPALVQFINGLEVSKNLYLLDTLSLASATTGGIRLKVDLRTFFRS
jgi:Tfp pilus assembly protein PilO